MHTQLPAGLPYPFIVKPLPCIEESASVDMSSSKDSQHHLCLSLSLSSQARAECDDVAGGASFSEKITALC